jgi:hypothetical protein
MKYKHGFTRVEGWVILIIDHLKTRLVMFMVGLLKGEC